MRDDGALANAPHTLIDGFGRRIDYLRVSITDRCNFRCRYCMCEDMTFLPKPEVLTLDELDRLCSAFVSRGVRKLRLTGGEPLVRRGVVTLVRSLSRHLDSGALDEITMTTNGSLLSSYVGALHEAGMRRVNVSLDTLDPLTFSQVTRRGTLEQVLDGLDAAQATGMRLKLNMVVMKGINDHEVEAMLRFTHGRGMDLTLIETMPMGAFVGDRHDYYLPMDKIRARLERRLTLIELDDQTSGPAHYVRVAETGGRLGLVTPLSHGFCHACNRVRVTCTGQLALCLGHEMTIDLRTPLRAAPDDFLLHQTIDDAMARKPLGHHFSSAPHAPAVARSMSVTGG